MPRKFTYLRKIQTVLEEIHNTATSQIVNASSHLNRFTHNMISVCQSVFEEKRNGFGYEFCLLIGLVRKTTPPPSIPIQTLEGTFPLHETHLVAV